MAFTFTDVLRDFAFYGFPASPLTAQEIDRLMSIGVNRDDIYAIGCDCAAGFSMEEALDAHFRATAAPAA